MNVAPQIIHTELPEAEHVDASHLQTQLYKLGLFVDRFHAGLMLVEHSNAELFVVNKQRAEMKASIRNQPDYAVRLRALQIECGSKSDVFAAWRSIAERDATMTIWDLCMTVYEIRRILDRCPVLNDAVPRSELEKAIQRTAAAFPNRKEARDVAAHPADYTSKSPADIARHSFDGGWKEAGLVIDPGASGTFLAQVSLSDGTIVSTVKGDVVCAKINAETLRTLGAIRDQVYRAFAFAEAELRRRMLRGKHV